MGDGMRPRLEVPIFGSDAAVAAVLHGANRLELNHAGSYCGTTPTISELRTLLAALPQPPNPRPAIRIMIRPRGPPTPSQAPNNPQPPQPQPQPKPQDFIYTPSEISTMAASISSFASSALLDPAQGDGFVLGVLRHPEPGTSARTGASTPGPPRPELDADSNSRLVGLARRAGFACVLHRAVDDVLSRPSRPSLGGGLRSADVAGAAEMVMERVAACGFEGVLTSGGRGRAVENVRVLKGLVAARGAVEVIVGGGVRRENLGELVQGLEGEGGGGGVGNGVWFHSSCLGRGLEFDEEEARGLAEEMRSLGLLLP